MLLRRGAGADIVATMKDGRDEAVAKTYDEGNFPLIVVDAKASSSADGRRRRHRKTCETPIETLMTLLHKAASAT